MQKASGMIKPEKKSNKWICDLTDSQIDEIRALDKDSIEDSQEFLLIIESFGILDSEKILAKAIETLEKNIEAFEEKLK